MNGKLTLVVGAALVASLLVVLLAGSALAQGPAPNDGSWGDWMRGMMERFHGPGTYDEMIEHMEEVHGEDAYQDMIEHMNEIHGEEGAFDEMYQWMENGRGCHGEDFEGMMNEEGRFEHRGGMMDGSFFMGGMMGNR
ncbi:MAG: hypothetical protein ACE5NP_13250 [Anaerolineae bacterium]